MNCGGNLLVRQAKIYTMGRAGIIHSGDVLIRDGYVVEVGEVSPRGDETVLEGKGLVVTPGLVDPHTHIGLWEEGYPRSEGSGNEITQPTTPQLRVLDSFNPADQAFEDARRAGVTTVQILPGSANVIGGEGVVVKTAGVVADSMVRRNPSGMKGAFGENPKNCYKNLKKFPSTRMAVAACMREALVEAENYQNRQKQALAKGEEPERNLGHEALLRVLQDEEPFRIHAHRSDDIITALRIADEFGVRCTIEHGTEGHLIAAFLAKKRIPVAYGPILTSRSKLELNSRGATNLLAMHEAGVPLALTTDHPVVPISFLMLQGVELCRCGLPLMEVLKLLTINGAAHLDLEDEIGSLERGKRGDLVLWKGEPLEVTGTPLCTVIDGKVVFSEQ